MPTTPSWEAARNGLPGDLDAVNHASQINQFLGTHGVTSLYAGNRIYDTWNQTNSGAYEGFFWINPTNVGTPSNASLLNYDFDQSFVMPSGSTAIGRIQTAVLPVGAGADLQVALCADNAGSPGTVLASTVMPKEWITQLGASAGYANSGPLATPFNNTYVQGFATQRPWNAASTSTNGVLSSATAAAYGQQLILAGGNDSNSGSPVATVITTQLTSSGPTPGVLQPSLPAACSALGLAASQSWVVAVGGSNAAGSVAIANTFTAGWNSSTGAIGSWSAQASLPQALEEPATIIYQDTYVYAIGGISASGSDLNTVYWAAMSNGQITTWNTGPSIPVACHGSMIGIFGNMLVIAGGLREGTTSISNVYWTYINSDGSLSSWNTGPSLPTAIGTQSGSTYLVTEAGFATSGGQISLPSTSFAPDTQGLSINLNGAGTWVPQNYGGSTSNLLTGGYANGDGSYTAIDFLIINGQSNSETGLIYTTPYLSIPLPATGLTSGNTYHVQFHQLNGDQDDYLQLGEHYSSSQSWLYSTRYSGGPWSAHASHAIPLTIFDQSTGGNILHTWEDPTSSPGLLATRTSEYVYDIKGRLLGYCESTALPNEPKNSNPWTTSNCTLAQSAAQTHGGYPYSGLMTPNGSSATVFVQSENLPVAVGQYYLASGWFYSPTGDSNVSLTVAWLDRSGSQIGVFNNTVTVPAATWTQLNNTVQAPAGATYAALAPAEGGTPSTSNTLYLSNVTLTSVDPTTLATVSQVNYGSGVWPPTGVTQLA
jgi:hypothetical protein